MCCTSVHYKFHDDDGDEFLKFFGDFSGSKDRVRRPVQTARDAERRWNFDVAGDRVWSSNTEGDVVFRRQRTEDWQRHVD